jgi:hypothetical protein
LASTRTIEELVDTDIAQEAHVTSAEIVGQVLGTDGSPVAGVAVSLIGVSDLETDSSGAWSPRVNVSRSTSPRSEQLFPGVPSVSVDTGGIVLIARGIISYKPMLRPSRTQFDAQFLDCVGVQVFVDGALMPQPFDVNTIDAHGIKGIELYRGPATTPPELRSPKTVCGTLAIWTRYAVRSLAHAPRYGGSQTREAPRQNGALDANCRGLRSLQRGAGRNRTDE